ncbi:MAG: hypothetical protein J7L95_08650, partial [Prolixibacteraceae bacterium]|nr:hypothetical protein [Prolixibacteraceae bacterium]
RKLVLLQQAPPYITLFLSSTENEESVITTIRSRAQLVKFPFISADPMRQALAGIENIDSDLIDDAAHLSGGNFIKALEYLTPGEETQFFFEKFQEMMRFAYKREVVELIKWADEMGKIGRDKQKSYFNFALRLVREYFVMNMKRSNLVYLNREEKEWGERFAPFINERNIVPFSKEFELGIKQISMNGNPRIIFLDTALRMVRLIKR